MADATITNGRLVELETALDEAGEDWPAVARRFPEFVKLSRGRATPPGLHRPWVLLNGEQEYYRLVPVRLVRFEDGWKMKGQGH